MSSLLALGGAAAAFTAIGITGKYGNKAGKWMFYPVKIAFRHFFSAAIEGGEEATRSQVAALSNKVNSLQKVIQELPQKAHKQFARSCAVRSSPTWNLVKTRLDSVYALQQDSTLPARQEALVNACDALSQLIEAIGNEPRMSDYTTAIKTLLTLFKTCLEQQHFNNLDQIKQETNKVNTLLNEILPIQNSGLEESLERVIDRSVNTGKKALFSPFSGSPLVNQIMPQAQQPIHRAPLLLIKSREITDSNLSEKVDDLVAFLTTQFMDTCLKPSASSRDARFTERMRARFAPFVRTQLESYLENVSNFILKMFKEWNKKKPPEKIVDVTEWADAWLCNLNAAYRRASTATGSPDALQFLNKDLKPGYFFYRELITKALQFFELNLTSTLEKPTDSNRARLPFKKMAYVIQWAFYTLLGVFLTHILRYAARFYLLWIADISAIVDKQLSTLKDPKNRISLFMQKSLLNELIYLNEPRNEPRLDQQMSNSAPNPEPRTLTHTARLAFEVLHKIPLTTQGSLKKYLARDYRGVQKAELEAIELLLTKRQDLLLNPMWAALVKSLEESALRETFADVLDAINPSSEEPGSPQDLNSGIDLKHFQPRETIKHKENPSTVNEQIDENLTLLLKKMIASNDESNSYLAKLIKFLESSAEGLAKSQIDEVRGVFTKAYFCRSLFNEIGKSFLRWKST